MTVALLALAVALALIAAPFLHQLREQKVTAARLAAPLPLVLQQQLRDRIPQAAWLDDTQQARWFAQVQRFRLGKRFVGCAGAVVSDDMRLLIAGMACLLRLQPAAGVNAFPGVRRVLIYPQTFLVPDDTPDELGLVDDDPQERIGEAGPGEVVLSWADVEAALDGDAVNVVVHEFAHALDAENAEGDGAPPMPTAADAAEWAEVMAAEFARLRRHRRPPVLDAYGAHSPGEFFGVATEAFFQRPQALHQHHPRLFALLSRYFAVQPPMDEASGLAAGADRITPVG